MHEKSAGISRYLFSRKEILMKECNWETAINSRRSTRSFETRGLDRDTIEALKRRVAELEVPFEHAVEVKFFKAAPTKKLYMAFDSPADNMAFMSETDYVSISKAGFVGELAVLLATELGISTCWYGHYNMEEMERLLPHLGEHAKEKQPKWGYGKDVVEGRRVIAVSPLGYWSKKGLRLFDRIQENAVSFKRKAIDELLLGDVRESHLSEPITFALDLARKAPSAANFQFWRFKVEPDQKTIYVSMPEGYKHPKWEHPNVDIGITACQLWLGLLIKGIECEIDIEEVKGCAVWKFSLK